MSFTYRTKVAGRNAYKKPGNAGRHRWRLNRQKSKRKKKPKRNELKKILRKIASFLLKVNSKSPNYLP
jgi:hypothetical protein